MVQPSSQCCIVRGTQTQKAQKVTAGLPWHQATPQLYFEYEGYINLQYTKRLEVQPANIGVLQGKEIDGRGVGLLVSGLSVKRYSGLGFEGFCLS